MSISKNSGFNYRVNDEIMTKSGNVRVIDADDGQIGVLSISEALKIADEKETDLIEIVPNAEPPVCKLIELGKFKYTLSKKKDKQEKAQRKQTQIKEVLFRPNIDVGDFEIKLKKAQQFLESGYKVKIVLKFKGRELKFKHIGEEIMTKVSNILSQYAKIIQESKAERMMTCTFVKN